MRILQLPLRPTGGRSGSRNETKSHGRGGDGGAAAGGASTKMGDAMDANTRVAGVTKAGVTKAGVTKAGVTKAGVTKVGVTKAGATEDATKASVSAAANLCRNVNQQRSGSRFWPTSRASSKLPRPNSTDT